MIDAWEINRSKIILEKELGKGTFGLVYSGIWHKDENTKPVNVAVKVSKVYLLEMMTNL
jgi:predicted Ser/Thr protein kinase